MNIKKFLQKIHSAEGVGAGVKETQVVPSRKKKVWLPPDLFLECEDIILQISDDPFEVKLKANYEVRVHVHVHVCIYYYAHVHVCYSMYMYMCM